MNSIPEKDWKLLRTMQNEKLSLVCDMILDQAESIAQERKGKEHDSFLELWNEIEKGNADIALMFDDIRRSNAIFKLMAWRKNGILNDEELLLFSEETQQAISRI
ncbi:MAG: hypothetical protein ABFR19_05320 [Pseudomonadota bacterium]